MQCRRGDLVDLASGEGEAVERTAVPVANDQRFAISGGNDAVSGGLAGDVVRQVVCHLEGAVGTSRSRVHLCGRDPVENGAK
jgi:hypothetical protein